VEETDEIIKIVGEGDQTKELFPLKMRDAAQAAGFAYIKGKGLIPEEDSDDYIPVSQSLQFLFACSCSDTDTRVAVTHVCVCGGALPCVRCVERYGLGYVGGAEC
jgi:hypothetical protein